MNIEASFIDTNDPKWVEILSRSPHDFYHLPGYVSLEASWIEANPLAFVCYDQKNNAMLIPLLERPTPGGFGTDAVTPYGYSSPVFSEGVSLDFQTNALKVFQSCAVQRCLISTFMRLHPIIQPNISQINDLNFGKWSVIDNGYTVTLPLIGDNEHWMSRLPSGHKGEIRRLQRNGATFVVDTVEAFNEFPRIYKLTMEKLNANNHYFYTSDYFDKLRQRLKSKLHCAAVLNSNGEVMCAGLFTNVCNIVQYHLSGTDPRFNKMAPTKLMIYGMRKWAMERGVKWFHLGGGLGGKKDALFEFKKRFGGDELSFRTVAVIHDLEIYVKECSLIKISSNIPNVDSNDFFPAYRAPIKYKID